MITVHSSDRAEGVEVALEDPEELATLDQATLEQKYVYILCC